MEEDIKVLEKELANIRNLIEYYTFESLDYDKKFRMERFEKAIENLIQKNKELIKENIELNDKLQITKNSIVIGNLDVVDDYTTKLKNKIKEQQKQLNIANKKILSQKGQLKVINTSYIPKSKVKEKIEVIQQRIKEETRTDFIIILKILENELEELLQGGDDK